MCTYFQVDTRVPAFRLIKKFVFFVYAPIRFNFNCFQINVISFHMFSSAFDTLRFILPRLGVSLHIWVTKFTTFEIVIIMLMLG